VTSRSRRVSRWDHARLVSSIHRATGASASGWAVNRVSRPWREGSTRPASRRIPRCLATACREMGRSWANSVAVTGDRSTTPRRTARRVGSARAVNTASTPAGAPGLRRGEDGGVTRSTRTAALGGDGAPGRATGPANLAGAPQGRPRPPSAHPGRHRGSRRRGPR